MKKLTVRPVFTIQNHHFIVDIDQQVLREVSRPENEISFIHHMKDMQTHYELRFDDNTGSAADNNLAAQQVSLIRVPQMCEMDPSHMSEKYQVPEIELKGKTDFDIIVDQEALQSRRMGVLPKIEIMGEQFYVDLRMQELRHAENFHPILSLHCFELTDDGWHYEAFYEPLLKQVVDIDPKLTEIPNGIVRIKIPNEIGLDPVSTARIYGMDERELLRRYPIRTELKAEVISLFDTHLPALIQHNKKQLVDAHKANAEKARPRFRPRF